MLVIAVVQLDRLLNQTQTAGSDAVMTALKHKLSLLRCSQNIDKWIFTASTAFSAMVPIEDQRELGIRLISGLDSDPLNEFYNAACSSGHRMQPLSNNPLVLKMHLGEDGPDAEIIDAMVENHIHQGHHYSRNHKLDDNANPFLEIMNFNVLDEAWREAILPDDRLKVTPYIYRQQQRLSVGYFPPSEAASFSA